MVKISFLYVKSGNIYECWYRYKKYWQRPEIEGLGFGRHFTLCTFEMLGFYLIL